MTDGRVLPDQLADLIREHLHSIEALEVLLLLRRSVPRAWTVQQLAVELSTSEEDIVGAVQQLVTSQLVTPVGSDSSFHYVYEAQAGLARSVVDLERLYRSDRTEILQTIASGAIYRVRNGARKAFPGLFRRTDGKKVE